MFISTIDNLYNSESLFCPGIVNYLNKENFKHWQEILKNIHFKGKIIIY